MRLIVATLAVVVGLPAAVLTAFILVPAPTVATLALAVLAPEIAVTLFAWNTVAFGLAVAMLRGRARVVLAAIGIVVIAIDAIPLVALPSTVARATAALRAALGDERELTPDARRALDERPFDLALAWRGVAPARNVRYDAAVHLGRRHDREVIVDVWRPPEGNVHPTVISIYGGAWRFGERTEAESWNRRLAARGYTVVAIDYRHVPQARWPAQRDDVFDAIAAVAAAPARLGVDPRRIVLLGRSAGAQLALLAAYRQTPLRIRGAIAFYAPTDLRAGYERPPWPDPANVRAILRDYLGGTPGERPAAYRAASPLTFVRAGLPPTLLLQGERDVVVAPQFATQLAEALRSQHDLAIEVRFPMANHAFDLVPGGLDGGLATRAVDRFLAFELRRR